MKIFTLHREQVLPCSLEQAWEFLSDPRNLEKITPHDMGFEIRKVSMDGPTYQGQLIMYKVGVFPGVRVSWLTEITHLAKPRYFVDEQRFGPYTLWHHQHRLEETDGGVKMTDEVNYRLPFGILGLLLHRIYIRRKLEEIFDFRKYAILEYLAGSPEVNAVDES